MHQLDSFSSVLPGDPIIAKHISYYYFHDLKPDNQQHNYIYYPHYRNALNVYKNTTVTWNNNGRIIESSAEENLTSLYTILKGKSRLVTMNGRARGIGIVFKPLGINQFINCSLDAIITDTITPFNYFGNPFLEHCQKIFEEPSLIKKTLLLDTFFKKKLIGFDHSDLKQIVDHILYEDPNYSIGDMAKLLGSNRKKVYRLFKKHLCFTPSEFKSLVKFRKALETFKDKNQVVNLTEIAYKSGYYDQAEFIRRNKALVGLTPKELYTSLKKIGKLDVYWNPLDI